MSRPFSIAALSAFLWLACAPGAWAIDKGEVLYHQLIENLRGREPQPVRFPLYCRRLGDSYAMQQSRTITWPDGPYQRSTTYRVHWDSYVLRRSPRKVDFSKRYYGLEPGECAWEDRPLAQTEPDRVCYVTRIFYSGGIVPTFLQEKRSEGWKEGDKVASFPFGMFLQNDNEIWKIPAYTRSQPFTCLDVDFAKREWVAF